MLQFRLDMSKSLMTTFAQVLIVFIFQVSLFYLIFEQTR
jgi:hypothetical protein